MAKQSKAKAVKPRCKCGRVCDYYGLIGGFSVACRKCNEKNAKRQRDARAARKATITPRGKGRKPHA